MSQLLPVPWQASSFINSCTHWEPEWVEASASLTDSLAEPGAHLPRAMHAHITPPPHQQPNTREGVITPRMHSIRACAGSTWLVTCGLCGLLGKVAK